MNFNSLQYEIIQKDFYFSRQERVLVIRTIVWHNVVPLSDSVVISILKTCTNVNL